MKLRLIKKLCFYILILIAISYMYENIFENKIDKKVSRIAINYADGCCVISQQANCNSLREFGSVERCITYSREDLSKEFLNTNKEILSFKKGGINYINF